MEQLKNKGSLFSLPLILLLIWPVIIQAIYPDAYFVPGKSSTAFLILNLLFVVIILQGNTHTQIGLMIYSIILLYWTILLSVFQNDNYVTFKILLPINFTAILIIGYYSKSLKKDSLLQIIKNINAV